MISREYDTVYSKYDIMVKKLFFSAAIVTFNPMKFVCSVNAPKNRPIELKSFNEEQLNEIEAYLKSYAELPYVIEAEGQIYVIIPSVYPTSSMCIFLRIEQSLPAFLRFVRDKSELFVLSPNITIQAARMTKRLEADKKDFLDFCAEIERAFLGMNRYSLIFDENDLKNGFCEELIELSKFFAVPIESLTLCDAGDRVPINTNFSLFVAFSSCMLMLAKNDALDRQLKIKLDFVGGTLTVNTSFKTENKMKVTNETFLWDYLASDKRMLFEYYDDGDRFCVNFRPHFIDWAYLGLKQNLNDELFLNEKS